MVGSIGVAPPLNQALFAGDLGYHVGNLDYNRMVEGMTNEALAMLKAEIERLDSGSYLEAKRFIQSLAYEARL